MAEIHQDHETRVPLIAKIEEELDMPVVTFFTSFRFPVMLEDTDVDLLVGLLQMMDLSRGLVLIISSPGGDGLAAERMIRACRTFSETDEYSVIVPGKAKSAATMVCFGASKIFMGPTSELGPVDPQVTILDNGMPRRIPVHHIVESYRALFEGAKDSPHEERLEPYLQQLAKYDDSIIREHAAQIELSKDISIQALGSGMMKGTPEDQIEERIVDFLTPEGTKTHGRPIFPEKARECGLEVEIMKPTSQLWQLVYELYMRTNQFVSSRASKAFETKGQFYVAQPE
jgi:hypothetical protein